MNIPEPTRTSKLFNHDKLRMETAYKIRCPRCNGFGGCFPDDKHRDKCECIICNGYGKVWRSFKSFWLRPFYGRVESSEILY